MIFDAEGFELVLDKNMDSNIGALDCIEQTQFVVFTGTNQQDIIRSNMVVLYDEQDDQIQTYMLLDEEINDMIICNQFLIV